MLKKANIQWSAKQLVKSIEKGTIKFDFSVQRSLVWDIERKSLLIHSMLEGYPIPAFYAAKDEGLYQFLDGKQRSNAIADFMNGMFALKGVPDIILENGDIINICEYTYSQLPEELQDVIKDYSLTIYYFEGITDEEITEMFFRLNNGKPLTSIELTRVKAKSINKIKELSKHDLFTSTLTINALNKYTNEDIIIKSWALLNTENPSFETKFIRPLIESADITDHHKEILSNVYDKILTIYKNIKLIDTKESQKIAKRVITRTHLLSLVPIVYKSSNNNLTIKQLEEFVLTFFSGKKSATISEIYNKTTGSGSASTDSVNKRIKAICEMYTEFICDKKLINNTISENETNIA